MIEQEMLLDILTPDTIAKMKAESIEKIKNLGREKNYLLVSNSQDPYQHNLTLSYETKRINELSKTILTKDLDYEETILFKSELKFSSDEKLIKLIEGKEITLNDLEKLNNIIVEYQQANINYTMAVIKLEEKYNLKIDQAIRIVRLYPSLVNSHYEFNNEDKVLYALARKMTMIISTFASKKETRFNNIKENETMRKIESIGKTYFGYNSKDLPIIINKINEVIATNPELVNSILSNQKSYK